MNLVSTITKVVTYLMMVAAIIFEIMLISYGDEALKTNFELQNTVISPFLKFSYAALIVPAALALIFPLIYLVQHPKEAKEALIGLVGLGVIVAIAYALSSGSPAIAAKYEMTVSDVQLVDTGLIAFYLLILGAILAAVYSEVSKVFK